MHTPNTPGQDPQTQHGISPTGSSMPSPGYETSDVQVGGIAVFLISLLVFLVIFFVFCFGMGKVINNLWVKEDGAATRWKIAAGTEQLGVKPVFRFAAHHPTPSDWRDVLDR